MKSLLKIICRYSITAGMIILVILFSNLAAFLFWGYNTMEDHQEQKFDRAAAEEIGNQLYMENGSWQITGKGMETAENMECQWIMALDENGKVVWEFHLPDDFSRSYTLQDVAVFTRWYLNDYPVAVWKSGPLLLVVGMDKDVFVRISEIFPVSNISGIPEYFSLVCTINIVLIIFLVVLLGYRFYTSLKPIGKGIEKLSLQEPIKLKEKGAAGDLARQLNRASDILMEQKEKLSKRDHARTEWISGVSHDIRTPLALILGYSDKLEKDSSLGVEEKKWAEIIRRQSLLIRQLIQDLNLTSRLAYQAHPLNRIQCSPALLLRECAADIYNEEIAGDNSTGSPETDIELVIQPEIEKICIWADAGLLKRALRNLIGNCVRHNPQGCHVMIRLYWNGKQVYWVIADTGKGISDQVVKNMDSDTEKIHIMGLRLARQIAQAHGGDLTFLRRSSGTYDVEMSFPWVKTEIKS